MIMAIRFGRYLERCKNYMSIFKIEELRYNCELLIFWRDGKTL